MRWFRDSMIFTLFLLILASIALVLFRGSRFLEIRSCQQFQTIECYRELQNVFDACDQQTLVTFDVDDTLITSNDMMVNFKIPTWFKICAVLKYPSLIFNKNRYIMPASILLQQADRFVFDPNIVDYIQQLRRHGCNVVALTSMESGSLGVIKNMPEWRANMLQRFGINLRGQFPDTSFTKLSQYRGDYPCLYKGILCTNQEPKGKVLGAFLDYSRLNPLRIISFDDSACALASIASECARRGINFSGYQCIGAKKLVSAWNTLRAFLQLDCLMQHSRWLSDKEADALLTKETKHA